MFDSWHHFEEEWLQLKSVVNGPIKIQTLMQIRIRQLIAQQFPQDAKTQILQIINVSVMKPKASLCKIMLVFAMIARTCHRSMMVQNADAALDMEQLLTLLVVLNVQQVITRLLLVTQHANLAVPEKLVFQLLVYSLIAIMALIHNVSVERQRRVYSVLM